jgi:hypothetical protein
MALDAERRSSSRSQVRPGRRFRAESNLRTPQATPAVGEQDLVAMRPVRDDRLVLAQLVPFVGVEAETEARHPRALTGATPGSGGFALALRAAARGTAALCTRPRAGLWLSSRRCTKPAHTTPIFRSRQTCAARVASAPGAIESPPGGLGAHGAPGDALDVPYSECFPTRMLYDQVILVICGASLL